MAKKKTPPAVATQQPFKKIAVVAGSDTPTYYVNNINIDLTSFDVRFRCGQIQGAGEGVIEVKEIAYLLMSHAHFKALVDAVNTTAAKLEQIPPPRRIVEDEKAH